MWKPRIPLKTTKNANLYANANIIYKLPGAAVSYSVNKLTSSQLTANTYIQHSFTKLSHDYTSSHASTENQVYYLHNLLFYRWHHCLLPRH